MKTRRCTRCNHGMPADQEHFHNRKGGLNGLDSWCIECRRKYMKGYNHLMKVKVISHYGGKCAVCGEDGLPFLTIDHIDGGGRKHTEKVGRGLVFYHWLIKNDFPAGFQVLCWNHNWLKHVDETRNDSPTNKQASRIKYTKSVKSACIEHYGDTCQCCGEPNFDILTIDHVEGGGTKHRLQIEVTGDGFYNWLRHNDFPNGFRTLCFNCNCGRRVNGGNCPHGE